MLIPHEQLSEDALAGLIEEYVTRDGTDEADAPAKAARVRAMLQRGEAAVAWDEEEESATIIRVEPTRNAQDSDDRQAAAERVRE